MARRVVDDGTSAKGEIAPVFNEIRARIGVALSDPGLKVRPASQLELAISTFAPSHVVKGLKFSDYPFIGARYVSVRDGHVYVVAGATRGGQEIEAYRMPFAASMFTMSGGFAVAITAEGWMASRMIVYSLTHERLVMQGGEFERIDEKTLTRRSYPAKKMKAYIFHVGYVVQQQASRTWLARASASLKERFFPKAKTAANKE
ncbi:hypothetical protein [Pandoraea communis]|uniref:hypothetical protein n=1 Tax=Pandoraea communis TaxID=2508297 RepID=UPI0025A58533|nr:hypothetical protein [Pandoraea communis]MDM8356615.1 hypothetical protein [Pandoraea communis]